MVDSAGVAKTDAQTASEAMVYARDVRKSFGELEVLRGIDMQAQQGEVVAIIGPSGSGKSTFLRCINHLEKIDGGMLRVDGDYIGYERVGNELRELSQKNVARQRSEIGMVFQQWNLFSQMSVLANVMEALVNVKRIARKESRDIAMDMLDQVGLSQKADAFPSMLSGGQQQRVAIARAMAMRPKLMLFDEATSALDPELVGEVLAVIKGLAETGMTMILVTHEMSFARDTADVVYFIDKGRVVESGPPAQVLGEPNNERTASFLSSVR